MGTWVTILTFTYPHEAHLVKTKLESEGISVLLLDELTTQVNNFYSNAIGGVKLQVEEKDLELSKIILEDLGYINESQYSQKKGLSKVEIYTAEVPLLNKLPAELRLPAIVTLFILIILIPTLFFLIPSKTEILVNKYWCVDKIIYEGKEYHPKTLGLSLVFGDGCSETFTLSESGEVSLPGFNSFPVHSKWKIKGNYLRVSESDTLSNLYDGTYKIEINRSSIKLQSDKTTIFGHSNSLHW